MSAKYGYIGNNPSDTSVVVAKQVFAPTGVQTTFTFVSGYSIGYLDVYINGARQVEGQDYNATDTSTVGLSSSAQGGDIIELVAYKAFNVATADYPGDLRVQGKLTVVGLTTGSNAFYSGVVTAGNITVGAVYVSGIATLTQISAGGTVGTAGSVLSSTGSGLSWIPAGGGALSISTSTSSTPQFITFVSSASTTSIGITASNLTFIPSSGSLGIGTTNPRASLDVVPTATSIAGLFSGTTSSDMVRITQLGTGNALVVEDSANPDSSPFVITGIGSVGIGTTNPTSKLHVVGDGLFTGVVIANSDEKLKKNVITIENALEKVLSLRGVEYDRKDSGEHQIGVIAQEVERIIPEVVYGDETKSVAYGNLVGLLIEAIKEQQNEIEELKNKLS